MLKNGMNLISRQSSKLSLFNRLLCRNFITLSRYNNFRALNNNKLPIQMSLNFLQKQNMSSRENDNSNEGGSNGKEIFVANLPWRVDSNALGDFFSKYGDVVDANVVMDPEGRSKGFGFVKFHSSNDVDRVMSDADNLTMAGRQINVRIKTSVPRDRERSSPRERTVNSLGNEKNPESNVIFVGNLSFNSTEDSIREFFEEVGVVIQVRYPMDNGRAKSFCHVEFDSVETAVKAMERDGTNLDGRSIRLDYAKPKN